MASRSEGNGSNGGGYRLVIDSVAVPGGEGGGRCCIGHNRQRGAAGSSGYEKAPGAGSIARAVEGKGSRRGDEGRGEWVLEGPPPTQ